MWRLGLNVKRLTTGSLKENRVRRFFTSRIFGFVPGWLALILVLGGTAFATPPVFNGTVNILSGGKLQWNGTSIAYADANNNLGFGFNSLLGAPTGAGNSAYGYAALKNDSTGSNNVAVGLNALVFNTTASNNTAVGYSAMLTNTIGASNVAVGYQAMYLNDGTLATENVGVGVNALYNNTNERNTAVGYGAGYGITGYDDETAIGYEALFSAAGSSNGGSTAIGSTALYAATGNYDTALGYATGEGVTTGSFNLLLGSQPDAAAYNSITTGNQDVVIGYDLAAASPTASGLLNIQNAIYGIGNTGTASTLSTGCIVLYSTETTCPTSTVLDVHGASLFTTVTATKFTEAIWGGLGLVCTDAVSNLVTSCTGITPQFAGLSLTGGIHLNGTANDFSGTDFYFGSQGTTAGTIHWRSNGYSNADTATLNSSGNLLVSGTLGWKNGPTITSGSGAPTGACTSGSLYTRTDSGAAAGSEMYACRNVSGTGAWQAVSGG
jgi:hypothetical protein